MKINAVTSILNFCVTHNTESLAQIGPSLIAKYQETMLWQLECKECHKRIPFESQRSIERCSNGECGGINSYIRIRRLTRGSLVTAISLRTFFDWAELRGLVTSNPLTTIVCGGSKAFTIRNERGGMVRSQERSGDTMIQLLKSIALTLLRPTRIPKKL